MKRKSDFRWIIKITFLSVVISVIFTLISTEALGGAGYFVSFLLLAVFIALGIIFDIIGVAVTSASESPFHSMASHKARGAAEALRLVKNAEKVASICNDVVGDIAGIVSGATSAIIVGNLVNDFTVNRLVTQLGVSALVAGLTIGGKAMGKAIAINQSTRIVYLAGKIINSFKGIFKKK